MLYSDPMLEVERLTSELLREIVNLKMTEQFYLHGKKGHNFKFEYKEYGKSYGEREVFVKW